MAQHVLHNLHRSAGRHRGDTIQTIDNPDEPHLKERELQVLVAESGTTNWTRDYLCQNINGQKVAA